MTNPRAGDVARPDVARRRVLGTVLAAGAAAAAPAMLRGRPAAGSATLTGRIERLDPALDALIDADAALEPLAGGLIWCEGPSWVGGADGYLLYSDVKGNRIHRFVPNRGGTIWREPSGYAGPLFPEVIAEPGTNGLYATAHGVLACDSGNRCVVRFDDTSHKRTVLHDRFEGRRFNSPNDLCVSPRDGSIYFTDPAYGLKGNLASPARELDYTGIFRIAPDGALSLVGKFDVPNGIGISPDGATLYCTDVGKGWLAHRLDRDGAIADTRVFIDPSASGITGGDGLKIDARGNMWTSMRGGIAIVDPSGRVLGKIVTNGIVSNCEIGNGWLYMTCDHQIARIRIKARKLATDWQPAPRAPT